MRPRSTILGNTDVAVLPGVYVATVGAAIGLREIVVAEGMPDLIALLCALIAITSGGWLAWSLSRPGSQAWRARPEPYFAVAVGGAVLAAIVSWRDEGVASAYLSVLIVGAIFFGLVMPRGWSLLALLVLFTGCVVTWRLSGGASVEALTWVTAMYAGAWWMGSIGHRAHERAVFAATALARSDRLTGALNRRGFLEVLEYELATAGARTSAVLLLDLDDFKPVNDRFGHAAGDELLAWVGKQIAGELGDGAELGRLGGDEFAVLLPGAGAEAAVTLAGRIDQALAGRITASSGLAVAPQEGATVEQLLRVADGRLYEAKGRIDRRRA